MTTRSTSNTFQPPAGLVPGLDALGAYHLLRPLGAGGMAKVWLAVDARSGRQVAVKRMLPAVALDEELRHAFVDEGRLGLRLAHANIVETIEVGEAETATGPEPYIVLELLQGRALIELLRTAARRRVNVPVGVAIRTIVDAARALDHAHRLIGENGMPLGVVHRDVSPHNIFACADGAIKLVDFGIAKSHDQHHKTRTGLIKGKLAYLAPEQIRGGAADPRADVFALGIVLHELLVGRPLFRGTNDAETLHRVLNLPIPAPDEKRKDVTSGLAAITLRALQRDRERRLPTAGAFADAIEAIAEAENIVATNETVRAFERTLFPTDAEEHAEDQALAKRTYEHLSSSSLRAIQSDPWLTPHEGVPHVPQRRSGSFLGNAAVLIVALLLTTGAAYVTTRVLQLRALRSVATATAVAAVVDTAAPIVVEPAVPVPARSVTPTSIKRPEPPARPAHTAPTPSPNMTSTAPARHRAVGHGSLRLAAHPWAEVSLDGKALGTTPLRSTEVAEGPHTVVLMNRDLGVVVRRKVTIKAGQESLLVVDLFAEKR